MTTPEEAARNLAELHESVRAIAEKNERLIEEARAAGRLREIVREETAYGMFTGGDPRRFSPDPEVCTPEEMARHEEACKAAEAGEGLDRAPQCSGGGDGSQAHGKGFGCGVTTINVTYLQILDEAGNVLHEFF